MTRKLLSLVLALALCLSMCAVSLAEEAEVYQFIKYEEPVTLTTHAVVGAEDVFLDDDAADNNGYTRWCEETLGVKWELAWSSGDGESNSQRLDLAFASGELPDVISPSISQVAKYAAAGQLMDMGALIEQYGSPLLKWAIEDVMAGTNNAFFAPVTVNGKIYALPQMSDSLAWWSNNFIRTDILEELGCEMPTTLAELEAIFDKYLEAYPGSYPVAINNQLLNTTNTFQSVLTSYNASVAMWDENEEGNLEYTSIQPEVRAALERMASWYEKGYINPEFIVMDSSKNKEVLSSGDWLFTYDAWHRISTFCNTWNNIQTAEISAVPFLLGEDGTASVMKNSWYTSVNAITTSCENPEAVINVLNATWDSYYRNDVELREMLAERGYNWHYPVTEPQDPCNLDEIAEKYSNVAEPKLLWRFNYPEELEGPGFLNDFNFHGNVVLGLYGRLHSRANNDYASMSKAVKAGMDKSLLTTEAVATWDSWYGSHPKMITTFATSYDLWADLEYKTNKFCSTDTPTMVEKKAYLEKMELECFTNIIMGSEPIESFDEFVEEWKANGGDQITAEVNEWYASTK